MPERFFLAEPLAGLLPGRACTLHGYGMPQSEECFPLPVARAGATLAGVLSEEPALATILPALGGTRRDLPDGTVLHAADAPGADQRDANMKGEWDAARWHARWGRIAPLALDDLLASGDVDPATLGQRLPMVLARAASRVAARQPQPAALRLDMPHESVEVLEEATPHRGYYQTRSYLLRHPRYGGGMSAPVEREVFILADAAVVLPYDPLRDRVLLIEQFRLGPFGRGDARPWMLEPVAGRIDAGEAPETTARRECEEEAGLTLSGLEFIASCYPSPGCLTEYHYCYLGLADLPELAQGQGGLATEHEDIRTHVLPFEAAMELVATGEADNAPLILMLFWLQANRCRLRGIA